MGREGKWERAARLRDEALADMVAKASRDDLAAALLMLDPDEALDVLTRATAHSRVNDTVPRGGGEG